MGKRNSRQEELMSLAADTIRCLAMDAVQKAESGHPGMPMGCADLATVLWLKFLKYNPENPSWQDRDRFVLSAGHGAMLLYALLHLSGFDLPMSQIKEFRQWDSQTPGHPELGRTPGVDTTTGPLGQGFANGVGMAMVERHLAEVFNEPGFPVVDHFTYAIVSDGDLMEGISAEAASLAGHLGLGKLIYIYDCNHVTIEGPTSLSFDTENVLKRFQSYGWETYEVDGHNRTQAAQAITKARSHTHIPSLILAHTHIAYGSPNLHDNAQAHGAPLGREEVRLTKANLGFEAKEDFHVPQEVYQLFAARADKLKKKDREWHRMFEEYKKKFSGKADLWEKYHQDPPSQLLDKIQVGFDGTKQISTRDASGKCLQSLASALPNLLGGSADLAPSTKTFLKEFGVMSKDSFKGRNIHFGVREHAMAGIMNGMSLHGGVIPYGGTFLVFSDYMRPAIRLAALMRLKLVYIFSHDSIFVGEDGPTHQPVEQLMALRLIPGLTVIRPADAPETLEAWKIALMRKGPTALVLTRQGVPVIERTALNSTALVSRGAYILEGEKEPADCLLLASGSEVGLGLEAWRLLKEKGIRARVVSMPCREIFEEQPEDYRNKVLPHEIPVRLAIEAGRGLGWEKYTGPYGGIHSIDRFGASAPAGELAQRFHFTPQAVVRHLEEILRKYKP